MADTAGCPICDGTLRPQDIVTTYEKCEPCAKRTADLFDEFAIFPRVVNPLLTGEADRG